MRIYPIKIKNELKPEPEDRIGIDAEDLFDLMAALEIVNNNILENWFDLKSRLASALSSQATAAADAAAPGDDKNA